MRHYDNLVEALDGLKKEGYTYDFNLQFDKIYCKALSKGFSPNTFQIEETIHFEDEDSSPESRSFLFVITTTTGEKGYMIGASSIYDESMSEELLESLKRA